MLYCKPTHDAAVDSAAASIMRTAGRRAYESPAAPSNPAAAMAVCDTAGAVASGAAQSLTAVQADPSDAGLPGYFLSVVNEAAQAAAMEVDVGMMLSAGGAGGGTCSDASPLTPDLEIIQQRVAVDGKEDLEAEMGEVKDAANGGMVGGMCATPPLAQPSSDSEGQDLTPPLVSRAQNSQQHCPAVHKPFDKREARPEDRKVVGAAVHQRVLQLCEWRDTAARNGESESKFFTIFSDHTVLSL